MLTIAFGVIWVLYNKREERKEEERRRRLIEEGWGDSDGMGEKGKERS